jgi:hypothetical protein
MQGGISRSPIRIWLAIVGTATLLLGASYTMVQQSTRQAADDLPLSTAQSTKRQLEKGAQPQDAVPPIKTDLQTDTTPFVTITDNSRRILASSAILNGKNPLPPAGVFDYTAMHGNDHFTWQPAAGVRLATRVITYSAASGSDGFIITGQSLKQAEKRIDTYTLFAAITWLAIVMWTLIVLLAPFKPLGPVPKQN